jgi:flagellar assembly protein FliH
MGKVIKGSADSGERYTVAIPKRAVGPSEPGAPGAELLGPDGSEPPMVAEPAVSAEPAVDLEAMQAHVQEIVDEAARSAQLLIDDAELRARGVMDDATQEAKTLGDNARRQGREEGYASGVREAQAAMAGMLETMRELVEGVRTQRHALLTSAEPELVRLAVGIAERVLHQQIALDGGVVVEMARAAIAHIVDREKITVRVNPADIERMREHRDELLALGDVKTMRVIEDQRVDRGGVIVETDGGSIDAKISTQLTEARKILHIVDDVVVTPAPLQAAGNGTATLPAPKES